MEQEKNFTIYLWTPPALYFQRMLQRGRPEELAGLSSTEAQALHELHDKEYLNSRVCVIDEYLEEKSGAQKVSEILSFIDRCIAQNERSNSVVSSS